MHIHFEERSGLQGAHLGIVNLDAPKSLNALTLPMIEALQRQLHRWASDARIVCVLLRGNGDRAFCAGADVRSLTQACREQPGEVPALAARFFEVEYRLDFQLKTYPKPVLAWGHGYVLGGGMGLLQGARHRLVTPEARLGMPEINIGLFPDVGASWFLSRLPGRLGLFLGLTATQLNATDAIDLGLADRCLRADQQPALLDGLLRINWSQQPDVQLNSLLRMLARQAANDAPPPALLPLRERLDALLDVATLPAAWQALVALRDDPEPILATAAATVAQGCPLTAHLVWEQLERGRLQSLAQSLRMEYAMSLNCCRHPEFAEGVRARLVDRDNAPRWHWPNVDEVPDGVVQAHFQPTWSGPHPLADLLDHWR